MKLKKIIVLFLLTIIVSIHITMNINNITYAKPQSKGTSIYMWEVDGINYSAFDDIVDYLNINKIYAYIGTAKLNEKVNYDVKLLFEFAKRENIDSYIVYDENYDDQSENLHRIKELIDEVYEYNKNSKYKIDGIAIDSEFHTLESYRELNKDGQIEVFKSYVNAMKQAHNYAAERNIKYVACIPVWLDKLDKSQLEELIKNGCDYVQLMNYTKSSMIKNIEDEISIAKKYNKPIENIAELQKPGPHEVTDAITFYNDGLDACTNKFKEIDDTYDYDLLTFSYHYYKPVSELAKNVLDLTKKFNYELYPKDKDGKSLNIEKSYLVGQNDKIEGITIFNSKANEYITYFYGVQFGEKYELMLDDSKYELEDKKEIYYLKSDSETKYDEVICKIADRPVIVDDNKPNNDKIEDENKQNIIKEDTNKTTPTVEENTKQENNQNKDESIKNEDKKTDIENTNQDKTTYTKGNIPKTGINNEMLLFFTLLFTILGFRYLIKIKRG